MRRKLLLIWFGLMAANPLLAQTSDLGVHLFGSVSLPNGDFAKNLGSDARITRRAGFHVGEKIGLAEAGLGIGIELASPVWFKGLQWIFGVKVFVNPTDESAALTKFRSELGDSVDLQFEFGQWINIPIMTGFRYNLHFGHLWTLYGTLQAGVNWSRAASRKARVNDLVVENTRYDFARDFGFEAGVGLLIAQTYNIGFRYLALGTPRYDGTRFLSEKQFPQILRRENAILGEERSISMFLVTFGVQWFQ